MRRLGWLIAGVASALLCSAPAFARCEGYVPQPKPQNVGRIVVGQTYDQIIERGFILFAAYADFAPFSWTEGGQAKGVDVELGRLIADALGVKARFNLVAAGETVDDDLRNNVWRGSIVGGQVANVMLHVPYDSDFACRNEQVVLTGQYFNERIAIAWDQAAYPDGAPTPAYFRYDPVGVENDTLAAFYLANLYGGQVRPNIRHYVDVAAAMLALAEGEVGAVMGPLTQLEFGGNGRERITVDTIPLPGLSRGQWTLGVAVRHTYRQLGYAVGDAIAAAREDGRLAAIFAQFGVSYRPPKW